MPIAGMAAGASDALQEMLTRAFVQKQQEEQLKLQQARVQQDANAQRIQEEQFATNTRERAQDRGLREMENAEESYFRNQQLQRQRAQDDVAAGERRQTQNQAGVRKMALEGLRLRTADPRSAQLMAAGEGVDIPMEVLDPEAPQRQRIDLENLRHRNSISEIGARNSGAIAVQQSKPTAAGRGVLSGDANRIAELRTSLDDLKTLRQTVAAPGESGATGIMAKAGAMVPNVVTEMTGFGMEAKKKQAVINRVKQVIGKALEGGVLRKEDELKYEKILPTIGDPDEVVLTKLAGLDTAIQQRLGQQLEALEQAGYNVSGFKGGQAPKVTTDPDEIDALLQELLGAGR
jgi:hypothetical protein